MSILSNIFGFKEKFNPNSSVNKIEDRLWLGNYTAAFNKKFIQDNNISVIINCTTHIPFPLYNTKKHLFRININDAPEDEAKFLKALPEAAAIINAELGLDKSVLVHCQAGINRSATTVAAYLILYRNMTTEEAVKFIKNKRPITFTQMSDRYIKRVLPQIEENDLYM